jgi:hypothetical protein
MDAPHKHIVYCLQGVKHQWHPGELTGIDGKPVFFVAAANLCALASTIQGAPDANNMSQMVSYHQVVEQAHRQDTIVPMRFGSVFAGEAEVQRFLMKNSERFLLLLHELRGCTEMGIRLEITEKKTPVSDGAAQGRVSPEAALTAATGSAYLKARQSFFARQLCEAELKKELIEKYRDAFAQIWVKFKSEEHAPKLVKDLFPHPVVSLYFLIPKTAVDDFRAVFHKTSWDSSITPHLSGPWPPYNFV